MSKLKYFADIHISPLTCNSLRKAGYHVLRVNDVLPSTASDLQIIEYARQQNMVIITQDLDFSEGLVGFVPFAEKAAKG
ncbi:MAG: DUF5615 family PIN-like protein [Desulfotomaculales bacterium]